MRELLLGCGSKKNKRLYLPGEGKEWEGELVTLDLYEGHSPDILWDLNKRPFPFGDNEFDRIHAYEVLEHIGSQGDWKGFFEEFTEYWRILKPEGLLLATCPKWDAMSAWGDPSHTRVITPMTLSFLSQKISERDVGVTTMSDFRGVWKGDMEGQWFEIAGDTFYFVLKAIKP